MYFCLKYEEICMMSGFISSEPIHVFRETILKRLDGWILGCGTEVSLVLVLPFAHDM